jgi:transcriptional regulator with XRE-family HTH domain
MFHNNLKRAMIERNMNQAELSAKLGISKSSISQYLSGKNVPHKKTKEKLAEALDVSVAFLDGQTERVVGEPENLRNVTIEAAAEMLGKSKQFVRVSLQRGIAPFGFAVKVTGDKYSYHISPKRFFEYAKDFITI